MKKILTTILLVVTLTILMAATVHAFQLDPNFKPDNAPFSLNEELNSSGKSAAQQQQGAINATVLILQILAGGLLYFAAPLAIIMVGFAAFDMVVFGHDTEKVDSSKKSLTWAIVGLVVIILSYSITKAIISFVVAVADRN